MTLERKVFESGGFKAGGAGPGAVGAEGVAEMIVSVFNNTDHGGEVVLPGFFAESLATRRTPDGRPRVKGVWSHDWQTPIAKTLDARELHPGDPALPPELRDLGGLWVKGHFNLETQRGREAFSDLKFGTVDEFSIGYTVAEDRLDRGTGVRYLVKGELLEWSPVLAGMNPETALLRVKQAAAPAVGRADPRRPAPAGPPIVDVVAVRRVNEERWSAIARAHPALAVRLMADDFYARGGAR